MAKRTPSVQFIVFLAFCSITFVVKDLGAAAQSYPDCDGDTTLLGDALCDFSLNTADCGYDEGDCCECMCVDTSDNVCGSGGGFFCSDPSAPTNCTSTASPTLSPTSTTVDTSYPSCEGYLLHIQDGYCDEDLNVAACEWDGGDCCACTCLEGLTHDCGAKGDGFDCQDPDVPSDCDSANLAECTGYTYDYQDGICDDDLNTADCLWDGGDCCRCTCRDYSSDNDYSYYSYWGYYSWWGYYSDSGCGSEGYNCLDPTAPTDCDTEGPTPSPAANTPYPDCEGPIYYIGNGYCNYNTNNEECDWDGGDCCDDGYCLSCYDPDADCVSVTPSPAVTSDCPYPTWVGDGICDSGNNIEECSWDGGDCCACTCVGSTFDCSSTDCLDPSVDCISTNTDYSSGRGDDLTSSELYDDLDAPGNMGTPSPVTSGEAQTTSFGDQVLGFSGIQIIGIFTLTVFLFCCFGGTIVGFLFILHQKWVGVNSKCAVRPSRAQPQLQSHPQPSAPAVSALKPPLPLGGPEESEGARAKPSSYGETVSSLQPGGSGLPDGVDAGGPGANETKQHEEPSWRGEVKVA